MLDRSRTALPDQDDPDSRPNREIRLGGAGGPATYKGQRPTTFDAAAAELAVFDAAVTDFVSWFRGNTRASYGDDLRIFRAWCLAAGLDPLRLTRTELEAFLVHCEDVRGNSVRTLKRRLSTMRRFYALLVDDGLLERSPAQLARIRRRYRDEAAELDLGLSRLELAALLHAGVAARPCDGALVALMGGMGLRVSEACGLDVADVLHFEQDHRVVKFTGKGGKPATVPIPPQLWRVLADCVAGRTDGPLLLRPNTGSRMDRVAAARVIRRLAAAGGIERRVTPHDLRRGYVSGLLDAGASLRQAQVGARHADPRMTARYDRRRRALDQHPNYLFASWLAAAG